VPTRRGHFHGPLGVFLAFDLAEIGHRGGLRMGGFRARLRRDGIAPGQVVVELGEGGDRQHFQVGNQRCFGCIDLGDDDAFETSLAGSGGHWQDTAGMTDGPIQG